jgi:hypothetical protein
MLSKITCIKKLYVQIVMRLIYAATSLCFLVRESRGQGQQIWLDYQLDYPFANVYLFEVGGSYQSNFGDVSKWRNFTVTPTFEWQTFQFLDFIATIPVAYTAQTETYNSFELDPAVGVRYHITQNKRITTQLVFKLEERLFRDLELQEWHFSNRARLKGEVLISLNKPNLFHENLWWSILDYEEFFVTDEQLDERFANRRRLRLGLGYRLNYRNRFEVIYTLQSSRDEIQGEFNRLDNVIQFRYKMYLNPAKQTNLNDTE